MNSKGNIHYWLITLSYTHIFSVLLEQNYGNTNPKDIMPSNTYLELTKDLQSKFIAGGIWNRPQIDLNYWPPTKARIGIQSPITPKMKRMTSILLNSPYNKKALNKKKCEAINVLNARNLCHIFRLERNYNVTYLYCNISWNV